MMMIQMTRHKQKKCKVLDEEKRKKKKTLVKKHSTHYSHTDIAPFKANDCRGGGPVPERTCADLSDRNDILWKGKSGRRSRFRPPTCPHMHERSHLH